MTNQTLVAILLRVIGIGVFLNQGTWLLRFGSELLSSAPWNEKVMTLSLVAWLLFALLLIIWPSRMARILVPGGTHNETASRWSPDDLQFIAASAIGLYLLVFTFGSTQTWGVIFWILSIEDDSTGWVNLGMLVSVTFRILVGFWLLFGAPGLMGMLRSLRRARLDNKLFEENS